MNGSASPEPPSTPGGAAPSSVTSSVPRKPSTLKKRRPTEPESPGPSPLRKEISRVEQREREQKLYNDSNPRRLQLQKMILKYEVPRKVLHTSIGFIAIHLYINHADVYVLVKGLASALGFISFVDLLRFASRRFERLYEKVLGFLMRESEKTTWNGVIWYLIGVIFVLVTLPRDLATLSIMILSWSDTSASVIGRQFGKYTFNLPSPPFARRKSLAGTMGAFLFGGLSAYIFYTYAAPLGTENDLSWLGQATPRFMPGLLERFSKTKYLGTPTGFPDYLKIGQGARISTKLPRPHSTLPLWKVELISAIAASIAEGIDVYGFDDNVTLPVLSGLMIWASLYILG